MLCKKTIGSPIGKLTLVSSDTGIRAVLFENHGSPEEYAEAKESKKHPLLLQCEKELAEYFKGKRTHFTVPLVPQGTAFREKVWTALTAIPYGKTESYSQQAARIGSPKSARAVGSANGKNPMPIIVPCHRVIASSGRLGGYAGGVDIKRKLLEIEGIRINCFKALGSSVAG